MCYWQHWVTSTYGKSKMKLTKRINFYLQQDHKICYRPEEICYRWQTPGSPTPVIQNLSCNISRYKTSSDVQCVTLYSTLHKTRSAESRICSWDGDTALRGGEFHFLQVITQVLELKGSPPPHGLYVQET